MTSGDQTVRTVVQNICKWRASRADHIQPCVSWCLVLPVQWGAVHHHSNCLYNALPRVFDHDEHNGLGDYHRGWKCQLSNLHLQCFHINSRAPTKSFFHLCQWDVFATSLIAFGPAWPVHSDIPDHLPRRISAVSIDRNGIRFRKCLLILFSSIWMKPCRDGRQSPTPLPTGSCRGCYLLNKRSFQCRPCFPFECPLGVWKRLTSSSWLSNAFETSMGDACVQATLSALSGLSLRSGLEIRFWLNSSCNSSAGLLFIASKYISVTKSYRKGSKLLIDKVGALSGRLLRRLLHLTDDYDKRDLV